VRPRRRRRPAFWVELRAGLREVNPDALILGEATGVPEWLARYAGRIDAIFDFDLAYYVRQGLRVAGWTRRLRRVARPPRQVVPRPHAATLLDNHDMNRFLWMAGGKRRPPQAGGNPAHDDARDADHLLRHRGRPQSALRRRDRKTPRRACRLLWGADQNTELLAHFQTLGKMRSESVALRRGDRSTLLADKEVFIYERRAGDEAVRVALTSASNRSAANSAASPIELEPLGYSLLPFRGEG